MHQATHTASDGQETEVLVVGFIRLVAPNDIIENHPGWASASLGAVIIVDGHYEAVSARSLRVDDPVRLGHFEHTPHDITVSEYKSRTPTRP